MDFELTRRENDDELMPQLAKIKSAENIALLIPFAKAYLGMFYLIDADFSPKEKVRLLANNELAEAIFAGFLSVLGRDELPTLEKIATAKAAELEFAEGYVVLAGMDLVAKKSLSDLQSFKSDLLEKATGFHFSNKSSHCNIWFDYLLAESQKKIIPAISQYWEVMLKNNARYLPGRSLVLGDKPNVEVTQYCILRLLDNWTNCKVKTLSQLLLLAFQYSEATEFASVCERTLINDDNLNEKTRLYWLAAAYLISPNKYFAKLSNYIGRVKLKIMPLLDFILLVMNKDKHINISFDAKIIVPLLRLIAPVFPPQHHIYGALGKLDINSRNIMLMFYYLACLDDVNVVSELKLLRKARVMKIYAAVIDDLQELLVQKNTTESFILPDFDSYIRRLVKNDCLHGRSNKFDLR